jgi:hypothetical protein
MTDKNEFIDIEQMDEDVKNAFLSMSPEEQLLAIWNMQQYLRGEIAVVKKRQLTSEIDVKKYRNYREKREKELFGENEDDNGMSITQKVMKLAAKEVADAFARRFDFWVWFRDRVLPVLVTGFIIGLLYLVYGKNP